MQDTTTTTKSISRPRAATILAAAILTGLSGLSAPAAWSAETTTLPGGASSLHETYSDWTVNCALVEQTEAKGNTKDGAKGATKRDDKAAASKARTKVCAISQEVFETKTRQRAAAAQIVPASDNANTATATLILPFGVSLADGAALQIIVNASDDGKPIPLTLSLKGFNNALDRAQTLLGNKK